MNIELNLATLMALLGMGLILMALLGDALKKAAILNIELAALGLVERILVGAFGLVLFAGGVYWTIIGGQTQAPAPAPVVQAPVTTVPGPMSTPLPTVPPFTATPAAEPPPTPTPTMTPAVQTPATTAPEPTATPIPTVPTSTSTSAAKPPSTPMPTMTSMLLELGADTLYVSTIGGDASNNCQNAAAPCQTIAHAISQAGDGATIFIAAGTYTENLVLDGISLTLRGGYTVSGTQWLKGTGETVINGNNAGRVFFIHDGSNVVLENLTIMGGRAPNSACWGGGVSVTNGSATIRLSTITKNRAECDPGIARSGGAGGGLDANSDEGPVALTVEDSVISYNSAGDHGSAVNTWQATVKLTNVLVTGNSSLALALSESNVTILNSTISDNGPEGPAILDFNTPGTVAIHNTIVWNSGEPPSCGEGGGTCTITYSDIEGGWPGTGNIDAYPLFVDAANGNYRLQVGSPCIDAGTPTDAPAADIEGNPRDATPDMGAYEWTGSAAGGDLRLVHRGI